MMNASIKIQNQVRRGQVIVELFFFLLTFAGFFALAYYLHTVFEISQKQTMLLRSQAFIELGNHSTFTKNPQGKDSLKDKNSELIFVLGEKTEGTPVDIQKNEDFKKAVGGETEVDVTRALKEDQYWTNYHFPRNKMKLQWLPGGGRAILVRELQQTVSIVHNRSIDLKSFDVPNPSKTGLVSGSMTMKDFAAASNIKLPTEYAMRDNVDRLKEVIRALAKNDSSLSDEAAALEKSVNAMDSLSGSAQAVVISTAMSIVMGALGDYLQAGDAASGAAGSGKDAVSSLKDSLLGNFTDPTKAATSFADGSMLSGPLSVLTAPFKGAITGFENMTTGLASGGLFQTLGGLGQMANTAAMVGSLAGQDMSKVQMAGTLLQAPMQVSQGLTKLGSLGSIASVDGFKGAISAVSQTALPITSVATIMAPEMGVPLGYVGMALGAASAGAGALENLSTMSSAVSTGIEVTKSMGQFAMNVGAIGATASSIAGKDGSMFAYVSLGGAALTGVASASETVMNLKLKGEIPNPINVIGEMAKRNIDNAKNEITSFASTMQNSARNIEGNLKSIFTPTKDVAAMANGDLAKSATNNLAKIDKELRNPLDYAINGVSENSLSKANLVAATNSAMDAAKVAVNMKYNGDPSKALEAQVYIDAMQSGSDLILRAKMGEVDLGTAENRLALERYNDAGEKLLTMLNGGEGSYFDNNANAKSELRAFNQSSEGRFESILAQDGYTKKDFEKIKANALKDGPSGALALMAGGKEAVRFKAEQEQIAVQNLAQVRRAVEDATDAQKKRDALTDAIRRQAAGISETSYIVTPTPELAVKDFRDAASWLRQAAVSEPADSFKYRDLIAQADKLERLADSGEKFISAQAAMRQLTAEIDTRTVEIQNAKAVVEEKIRTYCQTPGRC